MFVIKVVLIVSLLLVFYQDIKERLVYWFLFPIIAVCSGTLLYNTMYPEAFKTTLIINLGFVSFLIFVVFSYSRLKLKTSMTETFGLGDVLLFFALAFTFSSVSFIILFVFGLVFALILHLLVKRRTTVHKTVPLAGYLSLFFAIGYIAHWVGILTSVYSI